MKSIINFPNYSITKDGRIWSKPKQRSWGRGLLHNGRWLKPQIDKDGYLRISLRKDGASKLLGVHRLVLETYVGPCPEGKESHHINGIKADDRIENLMWVTKSENIQDSVKQGIHPSARQNGEKNLMAKLIESQVLVILYLYKAAKFSFSDLAWQFDVSYRTIYDICKGKSWKHLNA